MAVEIEAKMRVANHLAVLAKLESLGATKSGEFFEVNTFFDTSDRSLLAEDRGLRLRVNRNEADKSEIYVCTYKGPRAHGPLKIREELEMDVGSPKDCERFFAALGFVPVLKFEKRRHSWKHNRCLIELDELPLIGVFVEIEGPDESSVMAAREAIGMKDAPIIKSSYVSMLISHLQEKGSTERTVSFPKQNA